MTHDEQKPARMTVVFNTDARSLSKNPLHIKSEFGDVFAVRADDALRELDVATTREAVDAAKDWVSENRSLYPLYSPLQIAGMAFESGAKWQARDAIATTRESELLAVIRAMDGALRYVEAHYDGMEKADIVGKAIRLAEQVV